MNSTITTCHWDPQRLGNVLLDGSEYIWGLGLVSQVGLAGTTYAQEDGLGSIRLLTDSSGNQAGSQTFDAYGTSRSQTGRQLPFGFAGQETDPESGLQYLRAREYDPSTGRFLTRDPLAAAPGWGSAYPYANDSPAMFTDPSGLWTIGGCVSVNIGFGIGVGGSVCGVVSSKGPPAITVSGGGYGSTGWGANLGVGLQFSNGNSANDLRGPLWSTGGSCGAPPLSGGLDTFGGGGVNGLSVQGGVGADFGLPGIPCDFHAGPTFTPVVIPLPVPDIGKFLGPNGPLSPVNPNNPLSPLSPYGPWHPRGPFFPAGPTFAPPAPTC